MGRLAGRGVSSVDKLREKTQATIEIKEGGGGSNPTVDISGDPAAVAAAKREVGDLRLLPPHEVTGHAVFVGECCCLLMLSCRRYIVVHTVHPSTPNVPPNDAGRTEVCLGMSSPSLLAKTQELHLFMRWRRERQPMEKKRNFFLAMLRTGVGSEVQDAFGTRGSSRSFCFKELGASSDIQQLPPSSSGFSPGRPAYGCKSGPVFRAPQRVLGHKAAFSVLKMSTFDESVACVYISSPTQPKPVQPIQHPVARTPGGGVSSGRRQERPCNADSPGEAQHSQEHPPFPSNGAG